MNVAVPPRNMKRGVKAEQRAETLERICNSAEALFAQRGFHGVTFKDVATDVGVHTSLLHYYFADKEALFDHVFSRRATLTHEARLAAIDAFEADHVGPVSVEDVLEIFVVPLFDPLMTTDDWEHHGKLLALINATPDIGVGALSKNFDPVMRKLTEMMMAALPGVSRKEIYWGFQMSTGVLMQMLARVDQWSALKDQRNAEKHRFVRRHLVPFMAAGFRTIAEPAQTQRNERP